MTAFDSSTPRPRCRAVLSAMAAMIVLTLPGCGGPPKKIIVNPPASMTEKPVDATALPAIYDPKPVSVLTGKASYYYGRWIGRKTANGEIYRASDITAAHKSLPFNTMVRVTNLNNGKSVIVRINNRGPFIKGRILDLSLVAAKQIDMTKAGVVPVRAEVLRKIPVVEKPTLKLPAPPPHAKPKPTPTTSAKPTPKPTVSPKIREESHAAPTAAAPSVTSVTSVTSEKPRKRKR